MRRGLTVGACIVALAIVGVFYAWAQGPGPGPGGPFGPGGPGPGGQFGRGRPGGGGGIPGGPGGPRGKRFDFAPIIDTAPPRRPADEDRKADRGLVANADIEIASSDSRTPVGFTFSGDVDYGYLGTPGKDVSGWGVRFLSGRDADGDKTRAGSVSAMVSGVRSSEGRWFRLRMRGLAQEGFRVDDDQLYLKVEFFGASGGNPLDSITKYLYSTLEQDRHELTTGKAKPSDGASWRTYALDFRLPFPEVDTLRVSAGFANGKGPAQNSEFWVDSLDVTRIEDPAEFASIKTSADKAREKDPPALESLVPLGGRWYYDPRGGSAQPPERFDHTNASKLYWRAGRLETPFADNMSSWLRRGWVDLEGKLVDKDRFIAESVEVRFTPTHMIVHTHNLPNHPTASFPDTTRSLDGNPNFVQEQDRTWYIPLEPRENPKHLAMNAGNENNALRLGPLGVAVNGVMLNDPYDAGKEEAMRRIDKCCGHPSPFAEYHYHKYPVCVKTPWFDDGEDHSPLIGWAFDGFGIYGPYESKGTMAKDSKENPLNAFNVHYDDARGWHYHVTPGRWPYILGGYWGTADEQNLRRRQGGGAGGGPEGPGGPLGQFGPPGQDGPQGQAGPSGPGGFRPPR